MIVACQAVSRGAGMIQCQAKENGGQSVLALQDAPARGGGTCRYSKRMAKGAARRQSGHTCCCRRRRAMFTPCNMPPPSAFAYARRDTATAHADAAVIRVFRYLR